MSALPGRLVLLGHPVSHSLSPRFQNAALRAAGIPLRYEALDVAPEALAATLADLAELRASGNVTIPHKHAADALADARGPEVRASGAANTLLFEPAARGRAGRIRAENTDGAGLLAALADLGVLPRAASIVMVGARGAAAGALEALTRRPRPP